MAMNQTEWKSHLEDMVDQLSLESILNALAEICYEKSQHIRTNYSDIVLSEKWKKAGDSLDRVPATNL